MAKRTMQRHRRGHQGGLVLLWPSASCCHLRGAPLQGARKLASCSCACWAQALVRERGTWGRFGPRDGIVAFDSMLIFAHGRSGLPQTRPLTPVWGENDVDSWCILFMLLPQRRQGMQR